MKDTIPYPLAAGRAHVSHVALPPLPLADGPQPNLVDLERALRPLAQAAGFDRLSLMIGYHNLDGYSYQCCGFGPIQAVHLLAKHLYFQRNVSVAEFVAAVRIELEELAAGLAPYAVVAEACLVQPDADRAGDAQVAYAKEEDPHASFSF